jgi:hypothetical protein
MMTPLDSKFPLVAEALRLHLAFSTPGLLPTELQGAPRFAFFAKGGRFHSDTATSFLFPLRQFVSFVVAMTAHFSSSTRSQNRICHPEVRGLRAAKDLNRSIHHPSPASAPLSHLCYSVSSIFSPQPPLTWRIACR